MAEPGAGPLAATKEGSDSNSPAQPPRAPPAPSPSTTAPSPSSKLLFHCRLDFLLPLSHLEMQENVGHVQ